MKQMRFTGPIAALVLALVAGACTGADASRPAAAATDPAATPVTSSVFTGTLRCGLTSAPSPNPEPSADYFHRCFYNTSDPRLNGVMIDWGLTDPNGAYGAGTLENDGGSWVCRYVVMELTFGSTFTHDAVYIGKGGYVGLVAYSHSISNDYGATFGIIGWVEQTP
jgi:hypothetical protein